MILFYKCGSDYVTIELGFGWLFFEAKFNLFQDYYLCHYRYKIQNSAQIRDGLQNVFIV
jgi:hypothetical protein